MEMLLGGTILCTAGLFTGELSSLHLDAISLRSLLSIGYLIVFGSLVGFSAYVWLLRVVPAARVATYAYVNPVIALILGWALAGEVLTLRTLLASVIIISGVVLIVTGGAQRK
jgi:drug/metabolite transporter (DMT)-like permease